MKTTAYRLQQMITERLGPGPGPEQFFVEEITPGIYAWYLVSEGELVSPLRASLPWKAYAKKAVDLVTKPGTGASSVVWEPDSGR